MKSSIGDYSGSKMIIKEGYKLDCIVVNFKETWNNQLLHWDILIKSTNTEENDGCHHYMDLYTPIEQMGKVKAIKEAVKLGGERVRQYGKLYVYFNNETAYNFWEWYCTYKIIDKLIG